MKILHLNLYRKYFDAIANGTKTIEYRKKTDYWKKRIEGREYDIIKFRNGYAKDAPTMLVEYGGYEIGFNGIGEEYRIKLGKITEVNYGRKNS
jgi:ASC-1-like (ASCH) protein